MFIDFGNSGAIATLASSWRFAGERQKLIAHNIANIDTPNFIQKDVSVPAFRAKLAEAVESRRRQTGGEGPLDLPDSGEVAFDSSGGVHLTPETPTGSILFHDKNNRDVEHLMKDSVENAMFYRMNVDFLKAQFDTLRVAISQRP
jgi:flagellar basal-body rod protein FlgB